MKKLIVSTVAFFFAGTAFGAVVTIDFEDQTPGASAPLTIDGYTLLVTGPASGSVIEEAGNNKFGVSEFWTCNAFSCGSFSFGLERQDGSNFALHSADIEVSSGASLAVTGYIAGGGTASGPIGSSDWLNLTFVYFNAQFDCDPCSGQYNQLTVDNINVSAVPIPAEVDIDPWKAENEVRPTEDYLITTAVNSTSITAGDEVDLDATQVDPSTLRFGQGEAPNVVVVPIVRDMDGDSDIDVVFGFRMPDTGIQCGDTEATLIGETYSGEAFTGTDSITTVECDTGGCHP
jgi:hypothetical protein